MLNRKFSSQLLLSILVGWVCATKPVGAQALPIACPALSSNIPTANAEALVLFRQRVLKAGDVGAAATVRPQGFDTAEAHGAIGNGIADDTKALQEALAGGRGVWLQSGRVYRFTRRLQIGTGTTLTSDGSATLLMAAGPDGFDNATAARSEAVMHGPRGTGLRIEGKDITLSDLFIVKEYADGRYVIGIDIVSSSNVKVRRVRLRGFSLAPGIISIRSSDDVEVSSSLIHASCTQWREVPDDLPSFQITGINVDDLRVAKRGSTKLRLHNNVISDLRMIKLTRRGEQSDGINFTGVGTAEGSVISDNNIQGVDEGLDLFGADLQVTGNRVLASGFALKLIHGAHNVTVRGNEFVAGPEGKAIVIFRANPPVPQRQVRDIVIESNRIRSSLKPRSGVFVDSEGQYPPQSITIRKNTITVDKCQQEAISCSNEQCRTPGNDKVTRSGASCG